MCAHQLADSPTGLVCIRDHDDRGHVYQASSGSWWGANDPRGGEVDE